MLLERNAIDSIAFFSECKVFRIYNDSSIFLKIIQLQVHSDRITLKSSFLSPQISFFKFVKYNKKTRKNVRKLGFSTNFTVDCNVNCHVVWLIYGLKKNIFKTRGSVKLEL